MSNLQEGADTLRNWGEKLRSVLALADDLQAISSLENAKAEREAAFTETVKKHEAAEAAHQDTLAELGAQAAAKRAELADAMAAHEARLQATGERASRDAQAIIDKAKAEAKALVDDARASMADEEAAHNGRLAKVKGAITGAQANLDDINGRLAAAKSEHATISGKLAAIKAEAKKMAGG